MFEKNLRLAFLLDFYGDVLDEHTGKIMHAYYDDDLSLSEIADGVGISRQGVRHVIKKGEEELLFLEDKLGLAARHNELMALSLDLKDVIKRQDVSPSPLSEEDILLLKNIVRVISSSDV